MESKLKQESLNNILQESSLTKSEFDSECACMGHRVSDMKTIKAKTKILVCYECHESEHFKSKSRMRQQIQKLDIGEESKTHMLNLVISYCSQDLRLIGVKIKTRKSKQYSSRIIFNKK